MTTRDNRRVRRGLGAGLAMLLFAALLAACGSSADEPTDAGQVTTAMPATTAPSPAPTVASPDVLASPAATTEAAASRPELGPDGHFTSIQITDDGTRHLIPLDEVRSGGPPKDGIPSIDAPQFVGPDGWQALDYQPDGLVIGVEVDGVRRAYPFQVLVWHELVNDSVAGRPLLISYCPLCGSGIVFERVIDGEPVEFGVSGKLYNSDLLMYDRRSDTLWSQITGTAVVGELTGTRLAYYPSEIMTWADWQQTYPDSDVLTRDTGYDRDYDRDPYGSYYTDDEIWFDVSGTDERLHPKTRVTGVEIDRDSYGAYPDEDVVAHGPVNDVLGDVPLLVVADPTAGNSIVVFDRRARNQVLTFRVEGDELVDAETGTHWNIRGQAIDGPLAGEQLEVIIPIKGFWFAWFAFHPETALWQPS